MNTNKSDLELLFKATLDIYRRCFTRAFRGILKYWFFAFVPIAYLLIFWVLSPIVGMLGVIGGFVMGFVLAILLANYFAMIFFIVADDKFSIGFIISRTKELFSPVIGILFSLFILLTLARLVFKSPQVTWVSIALNLALVVLFNPLPEMCYIRPSGIMQMFAESFAFIKENFIEWFIPLFLFVLPIAIQDPTGFYIAFASTSPLQMPELFIVWFSHMGGADSTIGTLFFIALGLLISMFIMIFRGLLFQELAESTRRKRIYQYKTR